MALSAIYMNLKASMKINGLDSSPFVISRGTRQGSPLSPVLFALAIEPLAELLRASTKYTGVQIRSRHHKISLFADNIVLYIPDPHSSLLEIDYLLNRFYQISGLQINREKSLLYPINLSAVQEHQLALEYLYGWITDDWKYLGVFIPKDFSTFLKCNLESIDMEVWKLLTTWNDKTLSWFEWITVVKMIVFPKYFYSKLHLLILCQLY